MAHELFCTCCILSMRAWVLIIGYLGLVFLHFYFFITLAYVTSRVLRPPWDHEIRCRLRQPLLGQVFGIWLIFRYHHVFSFGRRPFDFWIQFSCGYGWLGLHIWWWMIQCCLIFWSTIHLMPYWGIFLFRLRFIDLHGVAWSSSLVRCMLTWWSTVILSWSPSGVSLGPLSEAHTFWHLNVIMLLLLGDTSLMFRPDSTVDIDDWDYTFNDGWSDVFWFFRSTTHLMPYWGIFPFRLRFIDLHGVAWSSPLTRCMLSLWSTVILSWSPSRVSLRSFS